MKMLILKQEKKAVHNALERKRRDHIKEMFTQLRIVVPTIEKDKVGFAFFGQSKTRN